MSTTTIIQIIKLFLMEKSDILATTFFGLEEVLAKEIHGIGGEDIKILNRAVSYRGDDRVLYASNLYLRTALKILKPVALFDADNQDQLYERLLRVDFTKFLSVKDTFAVDGVVSGPNFTHSKFVALKTKDAIADFFRQRKGIRPDVDVENPDVRFNIHIYNNNCTLSIDSTGMPMSKRGYKAKQTVAPINEVLAAGIILLSGWDKTTPFLDPMCGSGTFAIEAAMMAHDIAPGSFRNFAFEKWLDFKGDIWKELKAEARQKQAQNTSSLKVSAFDISASALEIAEQNSRFAGTDKFIDFEKHDFFNNETIYSNYCLITNPPYGERLEDIERMDAFYKAVGDKLKNFYPGSTAWVISGNLSSLKLLGLHPFKKIKLFNGPIECKLHGYQLFAGKKTPNSIYKD